MSKRKIKIKPTVKAKPEVIEAEVTEAKATKKVASSRFSHGVACTYGGPSNPVNARKSKTRIPVEDFGTKPDYVLRERSLDLLKPLHDMYGTSTFTRGDLDAGVLKFAGWKGWLSHVGGSPDLETCEFAFTPQAFHE